MRLSEQSPLQNNNLFHCGGLVVPISSCKALFTFQVLRHNMLGLPTKNRKRHISVPFRISRKKYDLTIFNTLEGSTVQYSYLLFFRKLQVVRVVHNLPRTSQNHFFLQNSVPNRKIYQWFCLPQQTTCEPLRILS